MPVKAISRFWHPDFLVQAIFDATLDCLGVSRIFRSDACRTRTTMSLMGNRQAGHCMPIEFRAIASLVALVIFSLAALSLRPSQRKPIGSFSLARRRLDPFMRAIFNAEGYPRRYSWYAPLLIFAAILVLVWTYGGT